MKQIIRTYHVHDCHGHIFMARATSAINAAKQYHAGDDITSVEDFAVVRSRRDKRVIAVAASPDTKVWDVDKFAERFLSVS